ncbi:MAG: metallophosphoesterase [Luteolibacter sp.]|uniref:metallophosphoesterase n=1 Tax=Luteolibacter sp. TaxID=1962973 RepID=UPI0032631BA3
MRTFAALSSILALVGGQLTGMAATVTRGPYLQSAGSDRITVCWRTDVATTSEVAFGLTEGSMSPPVTTPGTATDHEVTLSGLLPETRFFYRIKGTPVSGVAVDVGGLDQWFRTSPPPDSVAPTRIWVLGDSGYQFGNAEPAFSNFMAANAASGKPTDAVIMLGDNAYAYGEDSNYQSAVFNRYANLLRNTPLWSTIGNHDDTTVPANPPAPYYSIFHFPTAGECGGVASGTESYYSFNRGNIHFICIDSNTYATVADSPGGTYGMVDWLKDDLKACASDWIIAYMHEGPYSKGSHDSDTELNLALTRNYIIPLLEQYGADLVLCGHSHAYERSRMIDGHYGGSGTFNATTMVKWSGNGSDLGGVNAAGEFVKDPGAADGAFQKPAATGRAGTVYAVVGTSSSVQSWYDGSATLVNPSPYPAHIVSLATIGNMVIEVNGMRLNAQFQDQSGAVRDDFTIVKGSTYELSPPSPAFNGPSAPGLRFRVGRKGATAFADDVAFTTQGISGGAVTPTSGSVSFPPETLEGFASFAPVSGQGLAKFNFKLLPATRALEAGAAPRRIYHIAGQDLRLGSIEATPSATWYTSRFDSLPASPAVWQNDADSDGLPLLLEYATGGEPGQLDAGPQGKVEGNAWIYRYFRAAGRDDLTVDAIISNDLTGWQPAGVLDTNDGAATPSGQPRRVTLPLTLQSKFIKLRATLTP